jgi:hypothetical protein
MADAGRLVQSAITLSKVAKANKPDESQKERAEAKRNKSTQINNSFDSNTRVRMIVSITLVQSSSYPMHWLNFYLA